MGWATLCSEHFRRLRYADGIVSCGSAETLEPGLAASALQLIGGLGGRPPPSWDGPGARIPLHGEAVTRIAAGSETANAIVDTGAELAIVSATAAKRLGGKSVAANV